MKLNKENFLIQVKYSDLVLDPKNIERYFLGYGGELYLDTDEIDNYNTEIIDSIKFFASKNGLLLRLHTPIAEIEYSKIKDTEFRMQSIYRKIVKLCKFLNVNCVVAHAEFRYDSNFPIDKQFQNAISLWNSLCKVLNSSSVYLNLENHYEEKPDHLISLVNKVGSTFLGLCVDFGHSNAFSNLTASGWLKKYPIGTIKEIHLADNEGDGDTHLPLGEGDIDFASLFDMLKRRNEKHIFVLEPRNVTEAEKSISFLKKQGFLIE